MRSQPHNALSTTSHKPLLHNVHDPSSVSSQTHKEVQEQTALGAPNTLHTTQGGATFGAFQVPQLPQWWQGVGQQRFQYGKLSVLRVTGLSTTMSCACIGMPRLGMIVAIGFAITHADKAGQSGRCLNKTRWSASCLLQSAAGVDCPVGGTKGTL